MNLWTEQSASLLAGPEETPLDQNPYAAPSLDVQGRPAAASTDSMQWFAVGTRKLWVMSLLTVGLYVVHWFERQYRFQKRARIESTWPLARAIFSVFFAHDLFRRVEASSARVNIYPAWSSGVLGMIFVVSAVSGRILDRVSDKLTTGTTAGVLGLLSFATVVGLAYPVVQVQTTLNEILERESPGFERNERFTAWNWILIALGSLLLGLAIFGIVAPAPQETRGDDSTVDISRP